MGEILPSTSSLAYSNIAVSHSESASSYFELIAEKLASQPWTIWLDSGQSQHPNCHYDMLVWHPKITLETQGEQTTIRHCQTGQSEIKTDDPLALIEHYQQQLFEKNKNTNSELPFTGGAVGYFGYDLGRRFEKLPVFAKRDIKLPEMAVGIYDRALLLNRDKQQLTLVCPQQSQTEVADWLNSLAESSAEKTMPFKLTSAWQSNMTAPEYQQKFAQVQDYLGAGDCYQINLAQRFSAHYQGDEFSAYKALRKANNAPFSAFMRLNHASVLSVSPERFLQVQKNKVQTKPIKGTRPRSVDPTIDQRLAVELANASKDRAENLMIVDLLRNDLSKACKAGTVKVPEIFAIESFPAVHHLVSTVEGTLKDSASAIDLLRGAFPGGSITGAPKIRAMEIIEELEPHRRSVYCGAIGYLSNNGNFDSSITIRTLVCYQQQIHCWAGGGLVADSDANSEYQETLDKVNRILPVLTQMND